MKRLQYVGNYEGIPEGLDLIVKPFEIVEMADEMAEGHLRGNLWIDLDAKAEAAASVGVLVETGPSAAASGDVVTVESPAQLEAAIAEGVAPKQTMKPVTAKGGK